jgi:AcrR family transcriptional regulator
MSTEPAHISTDPAPEPGRRPGGRRPGSSNTRETILAAARNQFAERGYTHASLRAIAATAGVDHKLIAYFFGSKRGLFVAASELPLDPAAALLQVIGGDRSEIGARLRAWLTELMEQPELHQRLTGMLRAAASDPSTAELLREFLDRELFSRATRLLGADGALRVNLLGSQLLGLIVARYVVKVQPLATMEPAAVAAALAPTFERYLTDPISRR